VTLVLLGKRPGDPTWKKLEKVPTKSELVVAKDFAEPARGGGRPTGDVPELEPA
jgi:hypothetical protein